MNQIFTMLRSETKSVEVRGSLESIEAALGGYFEVIESWQKISPGNVCHYKTQARDKYLSVKVPTGKSVSVEIVQRSAHHRVIARTTYAAMETITRGYSDEEDRTDQDGVEPQGHEYSRPDPR